MRRCLLQEDHGVAPLSCMTINLSASKERQTIMDVYNQQLSLTIAVQTITQLQNSMELSSEMSIKKRCSNSNHLAHVENQPYAHPLVFITSWFICTIQATQAILNPMGKTPTS